MTRKEAICWVNHLFEIRKEEYFNKGMMKDAKEVEEAQHMAIEALQKDTERHEAVIRASERNLGIVRCKDCKHRDLFSCPLAENDFQKDEDYCSWGERREP